MKTKNTPLLTRLRDLSLGRLLTSLIAITALLGGQSVQAATIYWDGTANPGAWGTAANWSTASGATTPDPGAAPTLTDDAIFSISTITNTNETVNLTADQAALDLQFMGTNAGTTLLQGSGAARNLILGASAPVAGQTVITVNSGAGAVTIGGTGNAAVTLQLGYAPTSTNQPYTFTNNSSNALTIQNGIVYNTSSGASINTLNLTGTGTGGFTLNGAISESNNTRRIGLVVNTGATAVTTLAGANTYGGGTTITSGIIRLSGAGTLGLTTVAVNNGALSVGAAGQLDLSGISATVGALSGSVGGLIYNNSNSNATLTIGNNATSNTNYDGILEDKNGGATTGILSLAKLGTGTTTLTAANTYSGGTTIAAGTLLIGSATAIGSGALTLSGSGTIDNTSGAAITLSNNNNINLSGGSLTFTGTNNLSFGTGTLTISVANRTITTTAGTLTIGSIDADTTGRTLTKAGASGTLAITGAAGATFQGGYSTGAGTTLIGNKTSLGSGPITLSGGTLGATADLSGSNAVINTLTLNTGTAIGGGSNLTLSGNLTQSGGSLTLTNSNGGSTILSGNVFLSEASGTGRTLSVAGASNLTISGPIADFNGSGTAGGLIYSGTGVLTLSSATSSYTGPTTLTSGAVSVGVTANLGGAASNLVFNGGGLQITGTTLTNFSGIGHTVSFTATKAVTLDINNAANTFTADQVLNQTTGSLTKLGAGTLILNRANTFTGGVNINGGTLSADLAGSLVTTSPGAIAITAGATLRTLATGAAALGGGAIALTNATIQVGDTNTNLVDASLAGVLTFTGNTKIDLQNKSGSTAKLVIGGASTGLVRGNTGNNGTLIINANTALDGATGGFFQVTNAAGGGNATTAQTITNGILAPYMVGTVGGSANADFLTTVAAGATIAASNVKIISYAVANQKSGPLAASALVAGTNYEITSDATANGAQAAYTLKIDTGTTLTLTGQTLTIGGGSNSQGAMILNGTAAVAGGTLNPAQGELVIYTGGTNSISSNVTSGSGGPFFTIFGPGTLTLTGSWTNTNTSGGITINSNVNANLSAALSNNPTTVNNGTFTIGLANIFNGTTGAALAVNTAGTVDLNGNSTTVTNLTGGTNNTTILGGTITNGTGSAVLTLAPTGAQTFFGSITGANLGLTKNTANTQTLAGPASYGGTTTINQGQITFAPASGVNDSLATLAFAQAGGSVQSTYGGAANTALTFSNLTARTAGTTGNFIYSGGTTGTTNKIVLTQFAGGTPSTGTLLDRGYFLGGTAYAAYDVGGYVRAYLAGDTNGATAAAGASTIANVSTSNVFVTGTITAQNSASVNTLNLAANSLTLASGQTLQTNGILASSTASINAGTGIQMTTAGAELVIRENSNTLTIATPILDNSTTALTMSGPGTLALTAVNGYTGATTVSQGTLQINVGSSIAASSGTTVQSGATLTNSGTVSGVTNSGTFTNSGTAGNVVLNSGSTSTINGGSTTGTITANGTLNFGNTTATAFTAGNISGTGATGTINYQNTLAAGNSLTFAGTNSFAGLNNTAAGGKVTLNGGINTFANNFSGNNATATTVFQSGTFTFPSGGNNGTTNQFGTVTIQGATVNFGMGRYYASAGGTTNVSSGSFVGTGDRLDPGEQQSGNTSITFNVSGTGLLDANNMSFGFILGGQTINPNMVDAVNQSGGIVRTNATGGSNGNLTLGGTTNNIGTGSSTTYSLSGGKLSVNGTLAAQTGTGTASVAITTTAGSATGTVGSTTGLSIGQVISGNANIPAGTTIVAIPSGTTITLSTGTGVTAATLAASTETGGASTNTFNWSGGQLTAATITPSAAFNGGGSISSSTLTNNGANGTTLAPGDIGTTGKTTINGAYTQGVNGTLAIDLAGTTSSGAFQDAANTPNFDVVAITGAAVLGGKLNVSLINGTGGTPFVPTNANSFTILTAGSTPTGSFTNVNASNGRVNLVSGGSLIFTAGTTSTLTSYLAGSDLIWTGATNVTNGWDVATTNFTKGGVASTFANGDLVTFDQTGIANNTINLNTTVSPTTALFSNTSGTYTVTGTGKISGTAAVTVQGAGGTVVLATTNDYTGATTVSAGTLTVSGVLGSGGGTAVTTSGTGAFNVTNTNGLTGTSSLTVGSGTTATLSAANNYSGATGITGTLQLRNATATGTSVLTMNPGSTLQLRADADTTFAPSSILQVGPGGGTAVVFNYNVDAITGGTTGKVLTLANVATQWGPASDPTTFNITGGVGSGYTLALGSGAAGTGALNIWNTTTVNSNTAGVTLKIAGGLAVNFNAVYTIGFGGAGNITVGTLTNTFTTNRTWNPTFGGSGTITLTGANVFASGTAAGTGTATISSTGTLALNNAGALGAAGNVGTITISSAVNLDNTTASPITLSTTAAESWNSDFSFTGTQALNLGTGAVTMSASRQVTVNGTGTTGVLTVGGAISGGGFGLTKLGTGSLVLSGANLYSGGLTIKNGTVVANVSNATTVSGAAGPSANTITLGDSAGSGNTASLLNGGFTVSNGITLATSATNTALVIGNNGAATAAVFSGPINLNGISTLSLTSSGTGSLSITGGISGTGNFAINNATTTATTTISGTAVSSTGSITNSGAGSGLTTISASITGSTASVVQSSATSALTLSGAANTYAGVTTVSAGTLNVASGASLGNTAIGVTGTATFAVKPGSGTVALGNSGTVAAGATLNLGSGTTFSMVDAAIGTTNLVQENTFAGTALTLNTASLNFELSGATADKLAVTGAGATASVTGTNTINLTPLAALTAGTYNLITTANAAGGLSTGGTFVLPNGLATGVVTGLNGATVVSLNNSANVESVTVGASAAAMTWTGQTAGNGATDANWNTTGSTNWAVGTTPVFYSNGNAVTFQDTNTVTAANVTAPSLAVVIQAAGVSPSSTTFNNSTVNYTVGNASGVIGIAGSGSLVKQGTGTVTLTGTNTYTGGTNLQRGTLQVNTGGTLGAITNALTMGTGSAGTLGTVGNLTINTDTTVGAMTVAQNTATLLTTDIAQLSILSGKTLTASSLSVGVLATATAATKTALGTGVTPGALGTMTVNGNTTIGGTSSDTTNTSTTVADLSGLSNFNVTSTGAGFLRVGYNQQNLATLTLANTANTINVGTLSVADSATLNYSGTSVLNLGGGTNALQAPTITIGSGKGTGTITFAGSSGSVTITGAGGSGTANITIGNATTFTYPGGTSSLLLASHTATVSAGTVIIAEKTGGVAGLVSGLVTFDTGTFGATSIQMALISNAAATNGANGTFTVGGPTANSAATGVVNVSGNFILAGNTVTDATASTSTGTLTINGGTVNVNTAASATGGIFDTTTSSNGTSATTLTLAGGTLNLNGGVMGGTATGAGKKNIGTLSFQSGTLKNVLEINGGSTALTKTTAGTLIVDGTNGYTGGTTISAGTLQIATGSSLGSVNGTLTVNTGTGSSLDLNGNDLGVGNFTGTGGTIINNATGTNKTLTIGNNNGTGGNYAGTIADHTSGTGTIALTKTGNGTLTLTGTNTFTGATTVNAGTLQVGVAGAGSTASGSAVSVNGASAVLAGTGTLNGATTVTLGTIKPGDTGGASVGTLNFNSLTYAGGATEIQISGGLDNATNRDHINVTNALTLSSSSNFNISFSGFTPLSGTGYTWDILDWGSLTQGGFSAGTDGGTGGVIANGNFVLPDISGVTGSTWTTSSFLTNGQISIVSTVPEPSRAVLLLLGMGFALIRRRRTY